MILKILKVMAMMLCMLFIGTLTGLMIPLVLIPPVWIWAPNLLDLNMVLFYSVYLAKGLGLLGMIGGLIFGWWWM